ncbi:MAG: PQQ-dependent sugar dehydrogenase [Opitutaceae bacterium]
MKPKLFSCISALCLLAIPATAATIDWTKADINDINDVDTTGTLVEAQNHAGTGANDPVTVAGIDFVKTTVPLTNSNDGDFFAYDTGDSAYNELLGDIDFGPNSQGSLTLTFTGLTSGGQYLFQVWHADDGGFGNGRTMTLTGTGDNALEGNEYGVGTFTADATSQDLVITASANGVRLNAVQLRELSLPPTGPVIVADASDDYVAHIPDASTGTHTPPAGWRYYTTTTGALDAGTFDFVTGGDDLVAPSGSSSGNAGNEGFEGGNNSNIMGTQTNGGGDFQIFTDGFNGGTGNPGHQAVVGDDLLFVPGSAEANRAVVASYTVSASDAANGTAGNISGSFRELAGVGPTGSPNANQAGSVTVSVYLNNTSLFSIAGADGQLLQAAGTFDIDATIVEGDVISFVVDAQGTGSNTSNGGDETALQAAIEISASTTPPSVEDDFFNVVRGSTTDLDVLANDVVSGLDLSTLNVSTAPLNGTATVQLDDTIQYVHTGGAMGFDSFEYSVDNNAGDTTYTGVVELFKNSNSSLTLPDMAPTGGFQFVDAFPGLTFGSGNHATCLETIPGNSQALVIAERLGYLQIIEDVNAATPVKSLFLDISSDTRTQTYCGLRGVAFHPDFATNRYFYVGYDSNTGVDGQPDSVRVSRFTANASDLGTVNPATEVILLQSGSNGGSKEWIHRINRLAFGPDGYLYIAVGDEGNASGPINSQTINDDFWSSVLRIDVDKKAGNIEPNSHPGIPLDTGVARFSIPIDNPFVLIGDGGTWDGNYNGSPVTGSVRSEMYATGFRNPWKIGFVPGTGELWVADDGHAGYEKFSIMPNGGNAGWGYFEGTDPGVLQTGSANYAAPLLTPPSGASFIQPVMQYKVPGSTATGGVKSIIGGTFYEGTDIAEMTGAYVFADSTNGDIWYMKRPNNGAYQTVGRVDVGGGLWGLDETGMVTETISASGGFEAKSYGVDSIVKIGTEHGIVAMTSDPSDGSILMLDISENVIRRLVFNADDGSLPATLTDTGAFSDLATLTPHSGIHPYDLNLRFWSDHADKTRFFAVDDLADTITYSEDGLWGYPAGSVWIKHFDMDLDRDNPGTNVKRLETRFLVKTVDDFYGVSYRWNAGGTEADLVDSEGEEFDLTITEGGGTHIQTWRIPSRGECRACHTNDNGVMLGFNTRQLNRGGTLSGTTDNFIKLLSDAGYLAAGETLPTNHASLPKYHEPDDLTANIEQRVRSYLAVNCSYCHYDGNTATPGTWSGEPFLTIEQTNLLHGEGIGFAVVDPTDRFVIPGNTAKSMLLSLASETNGYSRMPPLATDVVDQEGYDLIADWINNFANAKPTLDATAGPYAVAENTGASSVVGTGPVVTDLDAPDATRGTLTYSIVGGNADGYFDINPSTGELTVVASGLDYEENTIYNLSIFVSDGYAPNPGEVTTSVAINISDVVNDDSQGDGIHDEWALSNLGSSAIDPAGDTDNDGSAELLEFWADSDPNDPSSRGLVIAPYDYDSTPGSEGFFFEWTIRTDLSIGTDYFVQGASDLSFVHLTSGSEFTVISTTPVANAPGPDLSLIRIKVPTTDSKYFLRITSIPPL